ncbi:MAG: hypothetical protein V3R76_02205 [Gammaproteobacteria bacterium]
MGQVVEFLDGNLIFHHIEISPGIIIFGINGEKFVQSEYLERLELAKRVARSAGVLALSYFDELVSPPPVSIPH